ncbi:hypothetical protein O3M35_010399 [Rhynocoris fuscipes]
MFSSDLRRFRRTQRTTSTVFNTEENKDNGKVTDSASGDVEIDNSQHVLVKIATLYAERLMNDICLVVGGVEYPAHRLILCASSEVFQVMLMNPQWSESHESRVVLQETPPCAAIFGEFIRYFYTGQIKINHAIITPLLALADKYNVKDLTSLCIEYMCNHIALAATNNQLINWYQDTLSLGHHVVAQACQNFFKWNFDIVANSKDFGNCNPDVLTKLLQWNDLVVPNEITLYNHVVRWLEMQRQSLTEDGVSEDRLEKYMEQLVHQMMSQIRFPMMTPRQLAELLLSPLTTKYKEFFIEKMAIGMSFHSNQRRRIQEIATSELGRLQFTPRMYTSDTYSCTLAVDKYSSLPYYNTSTLVFSSLAGLADYMGDRTCDWVIDLSPKGVWFPKFQLIVWQGTVEVPESVLSTVRLSITCRDIVDDYFKVKIGLLVMGIQDGVEVVLQVVQRNHYFTRDERVLNLDDIIPFSELNTNLMSGDMPKKLPIKYLVGPDRDTLKIHIVIAPLSDVSSIHPQLDSLIMLPR